jgi:hypothetical protein
MWDAVAVLLELESTTAERVRGKEQLEMDDHGDWHADLEAGVDPPRQCRRGSITTTQERMRQCRCGSPLFPVPPPPPLRCAPPSHPSHACASVAPPIVQPWRSSSVNRWREVQRRRRQKNHLRGSEAWRRGSSPMSSSLGGCRDHDNDHGGEVDGHTLPAMMSSRDFELLRLGWHATAEELCVGAERRREVVRCRECGKRGGLVAS